MTNIAWTTKVWNPLRGCSRVSTGCEHCYAERNAWRFAGPGMPYEGLVVNGPKGPRWTGEIRLVPEKLEEPLRWREPALVFVNSMSDLFHESVTDEFIDRVFAVMQATPQHTFQILTKRPERMRAYMGGDRAQKIFESGEALASERGWCHANEDVDWPLPNVWLGASVENDPMADARVSELLATPAAVRWVSAEPLLGPIGFRELRNGAGLGEGQPWLDALNGYVYESDGGDGCGVPRLDWIVVGGESGPNARGCEIEWIAEIADQATAANIPVFVKQDSGRHPGKQGRIPDRVWRQEYPHESVRRRRQ